MAKKKNPNQEEVYLFRLSTASPSYSYHAFDEGERSLYDWKARRYLWPRPARMAAPETPPEIGWTSVDVCFDANLIRPQLASIETAFVTIEGEQLHPAAHVPPRGGVVEKQRGKPVLRAYLWVPAQDAWHLAHWSRSETLYCVILGTILYYGKGSVRSVHIAPESDEEVQEYLAD